MPSCRIACECCSLGDYWAGWCPTREPAWTAQSLMFQTEAFPTLPGSRHWGKAHHTPAMLTQMEDFNFIISKKTFQMLNLQQYHQQHHQTWSRTRQRPPPKSTTVVSKQSITGKINAAQATATPPNQSRESPLQEPDQKKKK